MAIRVKLILQPAGAASWEAVAGLTPGVAVWVRTFGGVEHRGNLRAADAVGIRVAGSGGEAGVPRAEVECVDVRARHLRNAAICWLAGALAGAQLGAMSGLGSGRRLSRWPLAIGALTGCAIGMAAGLGASGYRCLYRGERGGEPQSASAT